MLMALPWTLSNNLGYIVALNTAPSTQGVDSSFQFSVVSKLSSYSFESQIQAVNEDDEVHRAEDGHLWNPTSDEMLA
ncbi:hypothetical protein DUI87_20734 [Hirundo rustica rustica]|uniref:Uncharacterized protein n=1 Tax=Hirundo rustica rustica TaxID=333673 RepID=A0A3M0JWL0_HIRRU|nr:hypothetical protein DUI87_20734 [Hirundo rustica rustica]